MSCGDDFLWDSEGSTDCSVIYIFFFNIVGNSQYFSETIKRSMFNRLPFFTFNNFSSISRKSFLRTVYVGLTWEAFFIFC